MSTNPINTQTIKQGFTLIEMLVVIVIIGVILTFVTLSVGDGGQAQKLEQETRRLAALLTLASQEAIMQAKDLGVIFNTTGYQFYEWQEPTWSALTQDDMFRPRTLPLGIQMEIHLEGEPIRLNEISDNASPQLLLLSSGEFIPFEVIFMAESNEKLRYRLTGTVVGELNVQRYEYF